MEPWPEDDPSLPPAGRGAALWCHVLFIGLMLAGIVGVIRLFGDMHSPT